MFTTLTRRLLFRSAIRMNQSRGMAHITTELPKTSGLTYLLGGIALFIVTAGIVQANGLVTWGRAPDMDAARKQ